MTLRNQLIQRCRSLGIMLLDGGDVLRIDTPPGIRFTDGPHSIDISNAHGEWTRNEMYAELLDRLDAGVEECDDPDCDSCIHEPMDFAEIKRLYRGERLA